MWIAGTLPNTQWFDAAESRGEEIRHPVICIFMADSLEKPPHSRDTHSKRKSCTTPKRGSQTDKLMLVTSTLWMLKEPWLLAGSSVAWQGSGFELMTRIRVQMYSARSLQLDLETLSHPRLKPQTSRECWL